MAKGKTSTNRLLAVQIFVALWLVAICARLVWLQVNAHDELLAMAERQQQTAVELTPARGVIYDRNGNPLARSFMVKSLYAHTGQLGDTAAAAARLAKILKLDRDTLLDRLQSGGGQAKLVIVKRSLTDKEVAQVEALGLSGLRYIPEMKRAYLNGSLAAHVLGFVDIDENGLSGIERQYDQIIRGENGRLVLNRDAFNRYYDHEVEESVPGSNLHLTIDSAIQLYAEKYLAEGVRRSQARAGSIVMMKPQTGEILALASYPTYDPNKVGDSSDQQRLNRAVTATFEPGSIFKIVPYAAALEEKMITPDTPIDCGGGQIKIADRIVHDRPAYGTLTAAQALAKSSNIGAIRLGMKLGNERLARYIDLFGFGKTSKVELPGESRGIVRDVKKWQPTSIGSIPMGHEVSVTAVQAAAAFACIANGGVWVQPHIVKTTTSATGEIIAESQPETRRVVSPETAATLTRMLEGVVLRGTAKAAQMEGYTAAGKTGTAEKVIDGVYSKTKNIASFAGFVPAHNPEIVCIVSIDEPVGARHGGDVAAPIFAQAVTKALQILNVAPAGEPETTLLAETVHTYDVPQLLNDFEPDADVAGAENSEPAPTQTMEPASNALAVEPSKKDSLPASRGSGEIVVPDLSGRGIREAVTLLASRGLKIQASGEGVVTGQSPPPGTYVAREAICRIKLARPKAKKAPPNEADKKPPATIRQTTAGSSKKR